MRCMYVKILLLALVTACSAGPSQTARPPDPVHTPPTTTDPGSVQDVDTTPPARPDRPGEQGPQSQSGPQSNKVDGATCLANDECASGICEGEGCGDDQPGRCMTRARACTRDLRTYCGCDGKTFQTSGSCPGRRFASRTKCEAS